MAEPVSPGKEQGPGREDPPELASKCLPCREGCPFCRDDTPCTVQDAGALGLAVASFQGLCVLLDLACMVAVYHFRRNKVRWGGGGGRETGESSSFWNRSNQLL